MDLSLRGQQRSHLGEPFTVRDRALLVGSLLLAAGTVALGVALGTWRGLLR